MISVIVPTNRIGGIDLLFNSLKRQSFRDFELILVDSLDSWRGPHVRKWAFNRLNGMLPGYVGKEVADERSAEWFHVECVPPRDNPFPNVAYCRTVNTGIAHARGGTIVMLCDYSWLNPDCLATHAACQAANPGPTHLDYNYCALPDLKPGLPFYGQHSPPDAPEYVAELNATTDRYVADLASGKLDPFMWSIFAEQPTQESIEALPIEHRHRPCSTREADDWNWCSLKSESFPTELLLDMNGFDELMDVSHCYQDVEFTQRLKAHGIRWHNGPPETGMVTVPNPRKILNVKKLREPIAWAQRYTATKDYLAPVNPGFSLRQMRREALGL